MPFPCRGPHESRDPPVLLSFHRYLPFLDWHLPFVYAHLWIKGRGLRNEQSLGWALDNKSSFLTTDTSEEYIKVAFVHPTVHIFFSFEYVMYLNIASYLYGKQIKSKMDKNLYLQMIFICVRLNWLDIHYCHTMPLKWTGTQSCCTWRLIERCEGSRHKNHPCVERLNPIVT